MSSGTRTTQMPYFSFHRSSTPMPYSLGKPTLNCCGGSLSTLGNMKRPVAASAAADAAENAPHERPIQARRVRSGDVSSGSRAGAGLAAAAGAVVRAAAGAVVRAAAAPPADATVVVLPAISAAGGGFGGTAAAGRAPVAAAARATAASCAPGAGRLAW